MLPLLSTHLFAETCCGADALRAARRAGFPSLELRADSLGVDLLAPGEAERIARALRAEGSRAAWLRIGPEITGRFSDPATFLRFGDAARSLGVEGVTVHGQLRNRVDAHELLAQVSLAGARLCLEREAFTPDLVRRWPRDVALSWDLAAASRAGGDPRDLAPFLAGVPSGRLLVVRVSGRDAAGRRVLPGEREAILLDETWRRFRPEYVVYDVEDPSGFGAATSLDHVFAELRSFHSGEKLPHEATYPGGLFGSA
jgi:hypothetical protein